MKISINDVELLTLSETQKNVIKNDIHADIFDEDMSRRIAYIIMHKYENCFDRLKKEWEPKLIAEGADSLPTDKDKFSELVFAHPDYKSRSARSAVKDTI